MKQCAECIFSFLFCLLLFSYWTFFKPPFQAPDEFSHFAKTLSISQGLFTPNFEFDVKKSDLNRLIVALDLHELPFNYHKKIDGRLLRQLKNAPWMMPGEAGTIAIESTAYTYPYPFYALVYWGGQTITDTLALSPYDSIFAYRLVAASCAALLWTLLLFILARSPFAAERFYLWGFCVLNPMVAYLAGSINPDALLLPAGALAMLSVYLVFTQGRNLFGAVLFLTLTALFKRPGLFMLALVPIIASGVWFLQGRQHTKAILKQTFLLMILPLIGSYLFYYAYAPAATGSEKVIHGLNITWLEYLRATYHRLPGIAQGFWGRLGWAEYGLGKCAVALMCLLLAINFLYYWRDRDKSSSFPPSLLLFIGFMVYGLVLYAVEIYYLSVIGLFMQGRYLLPALWGVAILLLHRRRWLKRATILVLVCLHVYLSVLTVDRYFAGDGVVALKSVPFRKIGLGKKEKPSLRYLEITTVKDADTRK